jgi:hypothetical protein
MSNGQTVVKELLEMSRREDAPIKEMVRLILSALVETMDKIDQSQKLPMESKTRIDASEDRIDDVETCILNIKEDISEINSNVAVISNDTKTLLVRFDTTIGSLKRNPMVWLGDQMSEKPWNAIKVSVKVLFVIMVIIVLFIGVNNVADLLAALSGIDPAVIDMLRTPHP